MKRLSPFLAFLLSFSTAFSQKTPDAAEILERYIEAVGGKAAWNEIQTMYAEGTMSLAGLKGRIKSWSRNPGKSRSLVDLGILKVTAGSDGETNWMIDQNGKVTRLGPTEARLQKLTDYFNDPLRLIIEKEKLSAALVREEADTSGGPGWYVLRIIPEGTDSLFLYFNKKTYLLDRGHIPTPPTPLNAYFSEYRMMGNVLLPYKQRQTLGAIQEQNVEIDSLVLNPELSDTLFALPGEHQSRKDYAFPAGETKVSVPFELISNHVHVKVNLNDTITADFVLDTGAGATVLSSGFASRHNIPLEGKLGAQGVAGHQEANLAKLAKLEIGGLTLSDQVIATIGLEGLTPLIGTPIDGILGYDFISRFVVEVDYDKNRLTMHDPASFTYNGTGQKISLELVNNTPTVEAVLDGKFNGRFRLDTGSSKGIDLNTPFVKAHGLLKRYPKNIPNVMGVGVGGKASFTMARAQSFEIGPFQFPRPLVGLWETEEGAFAFEQTQGNVGYSILKRFKLIFNYSKNELILEKSKKFDEGEKFDRSGLLVSRQNGKTTAALILPGSPAEKAGIQPEDEILYVNRRPVAEYSLDALREILASKPGDKVKITYNRSGKEKETTLQLKELL